MRNEQHLVHDSIQRKLSDEEQISTTTLISRELARELGLSRYCTGLPCPRGHLSKRYTKSGRCCECERIRNLTWFRLYPDRRAAFNQRARAIRRAVGKDVAYRKRLISEGRLAEYNKTNNDRRRESGKSAEYARRRRKEIPGFAAADNAIRSVRRLLRRRAITSRGSATLALGCTIPEFREHLSKMFTAKMTWNNYGKYWVIDHIRPLAAFNLADPEQFAQAAHFTNLRPLERRQNNKKSDKRELLL
jgi:5-methylcytosine-specific restriction endonuclease McrA